MQTAKSLLEVILEKSKQHPEFVFRRMYRNLFNRDLLLRAYLKLAPKEGNMTKGTDGSTIDGFNLGLVDEIIDELRTESFHPKPVRRKYIPKADGRLRPLGIPSFKDKLVQEALRELLEAIYEPVFMDCSHGFRPGRSCHTALSQIQRSGNKSSWAIEGDITGFFDNIDHEKLLSLVKKKVDDGRILELIRRFLKAGYMEDCSFNETELGSPQGGVLSPLLANIYLHELDKFVEGMRCEYDRGKRRASNPMYTKYQRRKYKAKEARDFQTVKEMEKLMKSTPSVDWNDPCYSRIHYNRYADDWLIFLSGNKKMAVEIKQRISTFLKDELKLELSEKKTLITNLANSNVRFLGYEITRIKGSDVKSRNGNLALMVPRDAITKRIQEFTSNGKATHRNDLVCRTDSDIVSIYSRQVAGLYQYYKLAFNVSSRIGTFVYYHYMSMLRTLAKKHRSSVNKIIARYGRDVPSLLGEGTKKAIFVPDRDGTEVCYPYTGFRQEARVTRVPEYSIQEYGKELRERIMSNTCEVCSSQKGIEVHHIRNLSLVEYRYEKQRKIVPEWVLLMKSMNRKTLVLCHDCHVNLHRGKLIIPANVLRKARCIERCTPGLGGACE